MKCKNCDGSGIDMFESECRFCGGMGVVEPLTEQEYIQTCNTEQLAEFLCDVWYGIDEVINIMSEDGEISKKDAMKLWLKQPHTTEVGK